MNTQIIQKKGLRGHIRILPAMAMALFALVACTQMDHTFDQYWADGEKVYPAPADNVMIYPGKNRIAFSWIINGDPNVKKARIFWNYSNDSLEVPINSTGKGDTVKLMLNDMPEGSYAFTIFTYDQKGNKSIPVNKVGKVYGDTYISSLLTRVIRSAFYIDDALVIAWGDPVDATSIGSEIRYTNTSGEPKSIIAGPLVDTTIVEDFKFLLDVSFDFKTIYIPDSLSIDTFYTAPQAVRVKGPATEFATTGWTATASSFDSRSGASYRPPSNTIDGNFTTIWVNQITPATNYPHTLTIDMGKTVERIEGIWIRVARRNETPKTVELLVSDNGTDWTSMGMYPLQNEGGFNQYIDFPEAQTARYFRIVAVAPTGNTVNVAIYEVGAYTR